MQEINSKKMLYVATGKIFKRHRGKKSNYVFGAEYDISTSLLSNLERGLKDPQLSTVFKLSQALGIKPHQFVKEIEETLPKSFSLIEN